MRAGPGDDDAIALGAQAAANGQGPGFIVNEKNVNRFALLGLLVGFAALAAVVALTAYTVGQYRDYSQLVDHTNDVLHELSEFRILSERSETARRGFLLKPGDRFASTYREAATELPQRLDRLASLTADNPPQVRRVAQIRALTERRLRLMEESIVLTRTGNHAEAVARFDQDGGAEMLVEIRRLAVAVAAEEGQLLQARSLAQQQTGGRLVAALVAAGVVLTGVAGASVWVVRRFTQQIAQSHRELETLNEGLEDAVNERTADLKRANDEIQRFAYIVSHDLRSPLVNVLGFTSELNASLKPLNELLDNAEKAAPGVVSAEAKLAVREDLPEAIGFIRSSTQKMDRLINAILQLSRQGQRVVTPERLNMAALLGSVADGVRHRLGEAGAEIIVEAGVPDVVSDRLVMEQVFGNLVDNAVKYLKPGRPGLIRLRGWREPGRFVFEVEDNGRGVAPKDHERIFDLFRRAGTQDQPGEGLGLAHVRALVYRLGGVITCASDLDKGATFRISLPTTAGA